jgi:hypothetical protein
MSPPERGERSDPGILVLDDDPFMLGMLSSEALVRLRRAMAPDKVAPWLQTWRSRSKQLVCP